MAAPVYTYVTVLDEIRYALDIVGTDKIITDAILKRFIFNNIQNQSQNWSFQYKLSGLLYTSDDNYPYGIMLIGTGGSGAVGGPTFTGETDVEYLVNAKGSIEVTSGTHSEDTISVEGARVDFPAVMVEVLHYLASHRSQEMAVNSQSGNTSPSGMKDELLSMADYWRGAELIK